MEATYDVKAANTSKPWLYVCVLMFALAFSYVFSQILALQSNPPNPIFNPKEGLIEKETKEAGFASLSWSQSDNGCNFRLDFHGDSNGSLLGGGAGKPCSTKEIINWLRNQSHQGRNTGILPKWLLDTIDEIISDLEIMKSL